MFTQQQLPSQHRCSHDNRCHYSIGEVHTTTTITAKKMFTWKQLPLPHWKSSQNSHHHSTGHVHLTTAAITAQQRWSHLHLCYQRYIVSKKKVKSSMARSLPVENLLPQNVGSIINNLQYLKQPNGELLVTVNHNQLRTMASETVDPIDWSHPPPSWAVPPERLVHSINQCTQLDSNMQLQHVRQPPCLCDHSEYEVHLLSAAQQLEWFFIIINNNTTPSCTAADNSYYHSSW